MRITNSLEKFRLVTTLQARTGSRGDSILHGVLPDGTELMIVPERQRRFGSADFVLMANGSGFSVTGRRERPHSPFLTDVPEPYLPGASRGTVPEAAVRSLLNRMGVTFHEQISDLPGKPDFYLPDFHIAVMAHGCFWHGHGCVDDRHPLIPGERHLKIVAAKRRDPIVVQRLRQLGIRTLTIWECALEGVRALTQAELIEIIEDFVTGDLGEQEIKGRDNPMHVA